MMAERFTAKLVGYCKTVTSLYPSVKTANPFDRVRLPVTDEKLKEYHLLLKLLTHCNTVLNMTYRETNGKGHYIATREDFVNALRLLKDLAALYKAGQTNLEKEKLHQLKCTYSVNESFMRRDLELTWDMSRTQTHNLIHRLMVSGFIYKAGGTKNRGYKYKLVKTV